MVEARERWEFLHTVIDLLPSAVCVLDPRGVAVAVNRASARPDRFGALQPGQNVLTLLAEVDDERNRAAVSGLRAALQDLQDLLLGRCEQVDLDYRLRADDGDHHFTVHAAPLHSGGQRYAVVSHDEIGERRAAPAGMA